MKANICFAANYLYRNMSGRKQLTCTSLNFIKIYLDFTYFACLSPFRIVSEQDEKTGRITITMRRFWPQLVLTAISTLLVVYWNCRAAYSNVVSYSNFNHPGTYFKIAYEIIEVIEKLHLFKIFWWNKKPIQRILTEIFNNDMNFEAKHHLQVQKWMVALSLVPYVIMSLLDFITGNGGYGPSALKISDWSTSKWWNSVGCMSRKAYLFENTNVTLSGSGSSRNSSFADIMLTLAAALPLLQRYSYKEK